jgi:succinylarginine dihydrolase
LTYREINFDGLIGPTHNYAGLSLGNVASQSNEGKVSQPRTAALQGLAKMRRLMDRGLVQGFLPPPRRPLAEAMRPFGFSGTDREVLAAVLAEDEELFRKAMAASSMWTANAATVIAAPDSGDGRTHLVTANLASMLHRSFEAPETHALLRRVFRDEGLFAVHAPLPHGRHFADEGAANHMRLSASHGRRGVNVFVHGEERGGRFPERQARRASEAAARLGGLGHDAVHVRQSSAAVQAGAFHNDVVGVANETLLLAHPEAYDDKAALFAALHDRVPGITILETEDVSLEDAVKSYLFNSQLVSLPDGGMALVLPKEAQDAANVWREVERWLACGAVREAIVVDVRESMRNGGGPACLRLRVPVSAEAAAGIDPRFILTSRTWDELVAVVERAWPQSVSPGDLADPAFWDASWRAHAALEELLASWA